MGFSACFQMPKLVTQLCFTQTDFQNPELTKKTQLLSLTIEIPEKPKSVFLPHILYDGL